MIVLDNKVNNSNGNSGSGINTINQGADNQNQMLRPCIEKLALELAKLENEKFSIPALKLLLSCIYVGKYYRYIQFVKKIIAHTENLKKKKKIIKFFYLFSNTIL